MADVKNLGLVQAIHVGATAPTNTLILWMDTNTDLHKYYDTTLSTWRTLSANNDALFDANTILKADIDNIPLALTIPEDTLVGRKTGDVIDALTASEVKTLLDTTWAETLVSGNQALGSNIIVDPTGSVSDNSFINSPAVIVRSKYDSDPSGSITEANFDTTIQSVVTTAGASPVGYGDILVNGSSRIRMHENGAIATMGIATKVADTFYTKNLTVTGDSIVTNKQAVGSWASIHNSVISYISEGITASSATGIRLELSSLDTTNGQTIRNIQSNFSTDTDSNGATGLIFKGDEQTFEQSAGTTATFAAVSLFESRATLDGSGLVTNLYHFKTGDTSEIVPPTNVYGLWIGDIGGVNQFPIYQSGATGTNWFFADTEFEKHMAIGAGASIDDNTLLSLNETITTNADSFGINSSVTFLSSTVDTFGVIGAEIDATMSGTAGGTDVIGAWISAHSNVTTPGTAPNLAALFLRVTTGSGALSPPDANVLYIGIPLFTGGKPTIYSGILIDDQGVGGITTSIALNIVDQTGSTNNYAIKTGTGLVEFGDSATIAGDASVSKHMAVGASASIDTQEIIKVSETVSATNATGVNVLLRSSTATNNNSLASFQGDFATTGIDGTTGHTLRNFWSLFTHPNNKTATFDTVALFETASQIGTGTGTVTNLYHFRTGIISQGVDPTNTYGLWLGDLGGTNQYPIYQSAGVGTNFFFADTEFEKHVAIGANASVSTAVIASIDETLAGQTFPRGLVINLTSAGNDTFHIPQGLVVSSTDTHTNAASLALAEAGSFTAIHGSANALNTVRGIMVTTKSLGGGTGALTNGESILVEVPTYNGSKPTNQFGINIANQGVSGITTSAAINIAAQSGSTNNFGIDIAGTATRNRNAGTREELINAIALSNGDNDDISVAGIVQRITGPTGVFTITGIAGGQEGKIVELINTVAQNMTIADENASSSASNRIITNTGGDRTSTGISIVRLRYDSTSSRWRILNFDT